MSFAIAAIAIAGVSAGLSAYGSYQQASAQQAAANYQAQIDANNAQIAAWQRSDALQRGEIEAQQSMREQAQLLGRQRAGLAASGVDVTQGSAVDLLSSTRFLGEEEINTIQSNAAREAWGYDVQGSNYQAASGFSRWQAANAKPGQSAALAGMGSLLSSASSYAMAKAAVPKKG